MSSGSGEFIEERCSDVSSQGCNSAYSSPSQLVPQSECSLDLLLQEDVRDVNTPYLKIIEQPLGYHKFRYRSEMQDNTSHGPVHGKRHEKNSHESHFPGVELFNYDGPAVIKCKLAQVNNEHEHPHRLGVNVHDISCAVPKGDSYKAWFSNLCIVHTPAREVKDWLYRGYDTETLTIEEQSKIRKQCESMSKLIQMNMVRLKFSAHRPGSGEEICAPVFSDPIRNLKCAATNILKICRLSRVNSRVHGKEDVIMLVERVIRKDIMIRFFELNENGEETWSDYGKFEPSAVHHQYAIVFTTPPYKDLAITKKVQVFVELVRPSDSKRSEPKEFFYTPDPTTLCKKRKSNNFYEKHQTVPIVTPSSNNSPYKNSPHDCVIVNPAETLQTWAPNASLGSQMNGSAKKYPLISQTSIMSQQNSQNDVITFKIPVTPSQMNNSTSNANTTIPNAVTISNDMELFENSDFTDYFDTLLADFGDLVADTGRGKIPIDTKEEKETYDDQTIIKMMAKELQKIVEMVKIKRESFTKSLQTLFDLRLSNGDTFLHLTLDSKQPLLDFLINLIHESNMTHLLNLRNASAQTILHQAVAHNLCDMIPFLVSKGCDPMLEDLDGNNAIHYGVKSEDPLGPLLSATEKYEVPRDLDAYNYEKQTPLHLAVIYQSAESARLLLKSGASCDVRDGAGRTPLHLAALGDCLSVAAVLLDHLPRQVHEVDGRGYTALQIVCDKKVTDSTIEMVKLLLKYKADPMQHQENNLPAWRLAHNKLAIRHLLQEYISTDIDQAEYDSEDEFQSADDGDSMTDDEPDEDIAEITNPLKSLKLKDDAS